MRFSSDLGNRGCVMLSLTLVIFSLISTAFKRVLSAEVADLTITWETLSQELQDSSTTRAVGLYNNKLYVIGEYQHIYSINVSHLDTSNSSWWTTSSWQSDDYGTVTSFGRIRNGYTQVDNHLYIIGPSSTIRAMLIYDMETQSQVDASSYTYTLPNGVSVSCLVLYLWLRVVAAATSPAQ